MTNCYSLLHKEREIIFKWEHYRAIQQHWMIYAKDNDDYSKGIRSLMNTGKRPYFWLMSEIYYHLYYTSCRYCQKSILFNMFRNRFRYQLQKAFTIKMLFIGVDEGIDWKLVVRRRTFKYIEYFTSMNTYVLMTIIEVWLKVIFTRRRHLVPTPQLYCIFYQSKECA